MDTEPELTQYDFPSFYTCVERVDAGGYSNLVEYRTDVADYCYAIFADPAGRNLADELDWWRDVGHRRHALTIIIDDMQEYGLIKHEDIPRLDSDDYEAETDLLESFLKAWDAEHPGSYSAMKDYKACFEGTTIHESEFSAARLAAQKAAAAPTERN